ncbi:MAG TPA: signal peptidase II, partial [Planctomycetota bacterium]|nr:signal peptidase II [Planctomycetota bacterium]
VAGRGIAVLVLAWLVARARPGQALVNAALVLVLAGAAGNLWDNLFQAREAGQAFGAVRDFISVYFAAWDYHFPTFNVADSCITVGAVLLLVSGFLPGAGRAAGEERAAPGGGAGSAKL